jgi:proteic killer suppression protein
VIKSYGDEATRDVHYGDDTKRARTVPKDIWTVARRKLNAIDAARALIDLQSPPNNRLEKLKGDLTGYWSIRINDQWRITFKFWDNGTADEVKICDYHR